MAVLFFCLSAATSLTVIRISRCFDTNLYASAREACGAGLPTGERPLVWNDTDSFIEPKVQALMQDFAARGRVFEAMKGVRESLRGQGLPVGAKPKDSKRGCI